MTRLYLALVAIAVAAPACTIETEPFEARDSGGVPEHTHEPQAHAHDWSELTGPSSGHIGIGTAEPNATLQVHGTLSSALTGMVSVLADSAEVTGSATFFTEELNPGDAILINSESFTVTSIVDDEHLVIDTPHETGASNVTVSTDPSLLVVANGDGARRVTVTKSGDIGVGNVPEARLDVNGNVWVRGDLRQPPGWNALGADRYVFSGFWNTQDNADNIPPPVGGITTVNIGGPLSHKG